MEYLDFAKLESIDLAAYRATRPYPWIALEGALTDAGYRELLATLPPMELFVKEFGYQRKHGQQSHDRYALEWSEEREAELPAPWVSLIHECLSPRYREIICRLYEAPECKFRFHWHYTPSGCSVSPHCDSPDKLGSHIFYLNTRQEWDPAWGGETLILDDGGRIDRQSSPGFEAFPPPVRAPSLGNRSLIFSSRNHGWHGVETVRCPEDRMRQVFIVVVKKTARQTSILRHLRHVVASLSPAARARRRARRA
jgi:hypothetical protein